MKPVRTLAAVLTFLALPAIGLGPRALADDEPEDLYEKVVKSCVFIITPMKGGFAMGSGSLIDAEKRYVITNYHVVDESPFVKVQFPMYVKGKMVTNKKTYIQNVPDGKAIHAKVLHRDKSRDLAVIQLEKIPPGTQAIKLAKESARPGTTTWNIGSPGAVEQLFSITRGEVRSVGVEDHLVGGGDPTSAFRVKAVMVTATNPTNPGDSGGPLFNRKGEQVAVTESGHRSAQNVNLFVDVTEVRGFLAEKKLSIKEDGAVAAKPPVKPKDNGSVPVPPKDNGSGGTPEVKVPTPPVKNDTPVASEADERAANDMLFSANLFKDGEDNRPTYIDKLKKIVAKYPTTTAGKEAKKRLDSLK